MLTFAMMFTPVFLCFLAVKYMQYAEYLLQYTEYGHCHSGLSVNLLYTLPSVYGFNDFRDKNELHTDISEVIITHILTPRGGGEYSSHPSPYTSTYSYVYI